jgi:hypothetical protein
VVYLVALAVGVVLLVQAALILAVQALLDKAMQAGLGTLLPQIPLRAVEVALELLDLMAALMTLSLQMAAQVLLPLLLDRL